MKKSSLSAAILAMTMMGCSETGVDNSMTATTSDAQKEKIIEMLKTVPDEIPEMPDSDAPLVLQKSGAQWSGTVTDDSGIYRLNVYAEVEPYLKNLRVHYRGRTYSLLMKKIHDNPVIWNPYYGPDTKTYFFSVCVQGCSADGTCKEHLFTAKTGDAYTAEVSRQCPDYSSWLSSGMGIVAMSSVSFNGGDISLTVTARKNLSNDVAKEVMKKYMFHEVVKCFQNHLCSL